MESTELCGYTYGETIYTPETTMGAFSFPTKSKICVQYTSGLDQSVCLETSLDWATFAMTCSIGINDMNQKCNSFEMIQCDTTNTDSKYVFSFDCSNIDGGYASNQCNNEPYTSTPLPAMEPLNPFIFLRFTTNSDQWNCCYDPTAVNDATRKPTTPDLVVVPTLSPIQSTNVNTLKPSLVVVSTATPQRIPMPVGIVPTPVAIVPTPFAIVPTPIAIVPTTSVVTPNSAIPSIPTTGELPTSVSSATSTIAYTSSLLLVSTILGNVLIMTLA
jgi:hypothetical protein